MQTETQEQLEIAQGNLGHALVYLKLVDLRVRLAAQTQPDLLEPAIQDVGSAWELIRQAQGNISHLAPRPARAGEL
jgi:hypothetical protein